MYVAGKIGSPHMNMIKAKAKASSDKSVFETSLGKIASRTKIKSAETGEAAMLGIRPSDIRFAAKGETGIKSTIQMLEPLGDVTVVSVNTGAEILRMVVPESAATSMKPGQAASIYLDHNKFHIFRASSGQAMT
jgi:multiple sugar transport system ATP-binding protein